MRTKLEVAQVSDVTKNNNKIVKLVADAKPIEVAKGIFKSAKKTYYMAVNEESKVKVGQIIELELEGFNVVERPFDTGDNVIMLKWLHLK